MHIIFTSLYKTFLFSFDRSENCEGFVVLKEKGTRGKQAMFCTPCKKSWNILRGRKNMKHKSKVLKMRNEELKKNIKKNRRSNNRLQKKVKIYNNVNHSIKKN